MNISRISFTANQYSKAKNTIKDKSAVNPQKNENSKKFEEFCKTCSAVSGIETARKIRNGKEQPFGYDVVSAYVRKEGYEKTFPTKLAILVAEAQVAGKMDDLMAEFPRAKTSADMLENHLIREKIIRPDFEASTSENHDVATSQSDRKNTQLNEPTTFTIKLPEADKTSQKEKTDYSTREKRVNLDYKASTPKTRIELSDSPKDMIMKLAEGNPGAMKVCADILTETSKLDPNNMMKGFDSLLRLDSANVYGSRIWCLYKDVCKEDIGNTIGLLKAYQFGIVEDSKFQHAIDNYGEGIDLDQVLTELKKEKPITMDSRK